MSLQLHTQCHKFLPVCQCIIIALYHDLVATDVITHHRQLDRLSVFLDQVTLIFDLILTGV